MAAASESVECGHAEVSGKELLGGAEAEAVIGQRCKQDFILGTEEWRIVFEFRHHGFGDDALACAEPIDFGFECADGSWFSYLELSGTDIERS